jgi:hypothetical protein
MDYPSSAWLEQYQIISGLRGIGISIAVFFIHHELLFGEHPWRNDRFLTAPALKGYFCRLRQAARIR